MKAAPAEFELLNEVDAMVDVQGRWNLIETSGPPLLDPEHLDRLRDDEMRLRKRGRWVSGPTTLLEVLRMQRDEVRNCRVVRWLLDPLAPHGLGYAALQSLLNRINELADEQGLEPRTYERAELATVIVEEVRSDARADIVIDGPDWQVVIEAKVGTPEGRGQGGRLSELWPNACYVFLTRRGDPMRSAGEDPWIRLRWADLLATIRTVLADPNGPPATGNEAKRARRAVLDYLHATRGL